MALAGRVGPQHPTQNSRSLSERLSKWRSLESPQCLKETISLELLSVSSVIHFFSVSSCCYLFTNHSYVSNLACVLWTHFYSYSFTFTGCLLVQGLGNKRIGHWEVCLDFRGWSMLWIDKRNKLQNNKRRKLFVLKKGTSKKRQSSSQEKLSMTGRDRDKTETKRDEAMRNDVKMKMWKDKEKWGERKEETMKLSWSDCEDGWMERYEQMKRNKRREKRKIK